MKSISHKGERPITASREALPGSKEPSSRRNRAARRVVVLTGLALLTGLLAAPAAEAMVTTSVSGSRVGQLVRYWAGTCAINSAGARVLTMQVTDVTPARSSWTTYERVDARMLVDRWDGVGWYRYDTSAWIGAQPNFSMGYFETMMMARSVFHSGYYRVAIEYRWSDAANRSFIGSVVDYYERGDFLTGGGTSLGATSAGTPGWCYIP